MASHEPDEVRNEVSDASIGQLFQAGTVHGGITIHQAADSPRTNKLRGIADDLADTIADLESKALTQLLGEAGAPRPANVTFDRLALIQWRADGSDQKGDLNQISDYYRALKNGRLVVVGDPGSGKTVLAAHLVRELLRTRPSTRCPVPLRVSLSSFNPLPGAQDLTEVSNEDLARRFDEWLVTQLVDRGVQRRHARELIHKRWILPVLDGLDEMDVSTEPPDHAAAVIRVLNDGRPFILTSRRDRHEQLLRHNSIEPTLPQDATTVILQPLAPAVVRDYLTYLFPDPTHPSGIVEHWRATADALADERPDPLVSALCSPWQLYLCRTAFANRDRGDPYKQLAGLAPDELTNELMRRLIPAAVDHHRRPDGSRYTADQVTTWLTTLARHLHDTSQRGGSSTDLLLHKFWWAAGPRVARYLSATMNNLFVALLLLLSIKIAADGEPLVWSLTFATAIGGVVAFASCHVSRGSAVLKRLDFGSLATRRARRLLAFWLALGIVVGPVLGYVFGWNEGVAIVGLVIWLPLGFLRVLAQTPSMISTPRSLVRQGLIHDFGTALTVAVTFAIAAFALVAAPSAGFVVAVFTLGLALGLMTSITPGPSPWPRYFVAVLILRRRHELPLRPAVFLDWAYAAGLLRLSGIAIQFRHDTFRAWLTHELRPADPAEPRRSPPPGR